MPTILESSPTPLNLGAGFFCSTANGYDGSLLNNLFINPTFEHFFHGSNSGIWAGIVTSMYQIGSVTAIPASILRNSKTGNLEILILSQFIGPAIDHLGRRGGMWLGALFIVVGTIVQGVTVHISNYHQATHQFMGGRFLLGFGVSLAASAGPMSEPLKVEQREIIADVPLPGTLSKSPIPLIVESSHLFTTHSGSQEQSSRLAPVAVHSIYPATSPGYSRYGCRCCSLA